MIKRILFVDDEPNILQGLKRMLRGMRNEWDMVFVESGEEALQLMEQDSYDAVISDMRMPGMDGAELLEQVKQKHPESVRFILSGHSDQELVMRSVGPSHQYLSKPCDPDKLKSTLRDTFALHELLASQELRTLVTRMVSLPSMPDIYRSLVEALQSEDKSITEIGNMIEQDIGMTAKVLQLVNSSYFGLNRQIISAAEAANFLGLDVLKGLVLANGVFTQFDEELIKKMSLQTHSSRSLAIATAARNIAREEGLSDVAVEQAFLGGLLHDMGSLVMATNIPEEYKLCIELSEKEGISMPEAEHRTFGTTHARIGAYMLGLWGIDEVVVAAVAYHHNPWEFPCQKFTAVTAVYIASLLIPEKPFSTAAELAETDLEYLESTGFSDRLPAWQEICKKPTEEAA